MIPALQPHADVLFEAAVFRREDIESAVAQLRNRRVPMRSLVVLLTYSPSQLALPALQRTRLPLVIWNTQELLAVDQSFTVAAHDRQPRRARHAGSGQCADAQPAFASTTSPVPSDDPQGLDELGDFFAAAAAVRRLRSARIGLLGYPFPGMGDFAVDTTHLAATLGCSWTNLTVEDYIQRAAAAAALRTWRGWWPSTGHSYDVAADVTDADLEATARAELAVRGMVSGSPAQMR